MVRIEFRQEPLETRKPYWTKRLFSDLPVCISVGGVDLLGYGERRVDEPLDCRWYHLSILDVAKWGLFAIKRAREIGQYVYELGRYGDSGCALLFKISGEEILIHSTMTEKTVSIPYHKLHAAWEAFAERVREYISREHPEAKEQPGWDEWLDGKEDTHWGVIGSKVERSPRIELFPHWRGWFDENPHAFEQIDAVEK
jgi:hypothetical protein